MYVDFDTPVDRRGSDSAKWKGIPRPSGEATPIPDRLPMFVADMDFLTPAPIVQALRERVEEGMFGYLAVPEEYYDSIIRWQAQRHRFTIQREWIHFSPGVVTGLSLAVQALTREGDRVIVQPPIYSPFYGVVETNHRVLAKNPLVLRGNRYEIDFDHFERLAGDPAATMFLLCSPHNPAGRLWSREELSRLAEICLRHHVTIVSDEIHSDLVYPGKEFVSIASLSEEAAEHTLVFAAPSKTFNVPGLRHAYAVIPGEENRRRFLEHSARQLHMDQGGILGYYAAMAGYNQCGEWVDRLMEYIRDNDRLLRECLEKQLPGVHCTETEATYLGWIDFSALGLSDEKLSELCRQSGVILGEGKGFSPDCAQLRRITLGCPRVYLEEALHRLTETFQKAL